MWSLITRATNDWLRHRGPRLGAALAYYAVFSLGPLLLIVIAVAGLFFGTDAVRSSLVSQIQGLLGEAGSQAVEAMMKGTTSPASGWTAGAVGVGLLLVAALGVVIQLKEAVNTIWEVEGERASGVWSYVRTYVISLAGILALGFLLTTSLVLSTAIAAITARMDMSAGGLLWQGLELAISLGVLTLLFGLMFKFFPDAEVQWADVWPGALATALLFQIGKLAIGWYVATQGLESTYGAVGSVIVLLIWVYYAAQIVLFGAALTHAYGERRAQAT